MIELLSLPYSRVRWSVLLRQMFDRYEERQIPLELDTPRDGPAARMVQLGTITVAGADAGGTKSLAVIEIQAADVVNLLRNRVGLRQTAARLLSPGLADGLLVVTTQPGLDTWRFTFVSREVRLGEDLQIIRTETAPRRFTYLLGPDETCRTAAERFTLLATRRPATTLSQVLEAFSVEKLNKEFFDTYLEHYRNFCAHLLAGDAPTRIFGLALDGLEDKALDRARKPVRDFVKKLLGRLVFLHFLQRKGWLGCDAARTDWHGGAVDFLRQLFDSTPAAENDRFHSTRLVPLFFDTLNDPRREHDLFAVTGTRVPYLNGGLFERDFAGVEWIDFPAPIFAALLEFFGQYHFTIDENDPEDHEVGIDPEMLGHIFENLLEDNKDKGAYYTPKAVVQYMCQQSLIHALAGRFPDDPAARGEIERLIRTKEPIDARDPQSWLARHATPLATQLDELRICDPAIGSGAFPIGLLQEIYWTKLTLNPALDRAAAKRAIIQRSIHGVDLDAGAVEIARLRFWLALIVEENAPVPLPNLDYQIMQGNSLLESFEGERLDDLAEAVRYGVRVLGSDQHELALAATAQAELHDPRNAPAADLAALRARYYACHEPEEKGRLRTEIDAAVLRAIDARLERHRDELETSLVQEAAYVRGRQRTAREVKQRAAMQAELAALDVKKARLHALLEDPRKERPFFLWHLWFRHVLAAPPEGRGGFDIVIANPPYVRQEAIKELKPALKAEPYECFDGVADLLVYFYECAVKKLRPGGVLTFITSNKFYRAGYGEPLRGFLARELTLHRLIDFGDAPVFDSIAYASILESTRAPAPLDSSALGYTWEKDAPLDRIENIVAQRGQPIRQSELTPNGWRLESPAVLSLIAKLRAAGTPLGEYVNGRFYYGIKTGLNEAFVVNRATRDRLIAEHASSAEVLKPYLRGRDIKRWDANSQDAWLVFVPWHFPSHNDNSIQGPSRDAERDFQTRFPAIYRHLSQFREQLSSRNADETEVRYEWYALQRWASEYWRDLERPKIVYPDIYEHQSFAWDTTNAYLANTCYFIPTDEKWLCALLNSSAVEWFYGMVSNRVRGGYLRAFSPYMTQVPIPAASPADQATLSALVDRILAAKRSGDAAVVERLEAEIDTHVFRLYGLTPEEIALVTGERK